MASKKGESAESSKPVVFARQTEKAAKRDDKKEDHKDRKAVYDTNKLESVKQKMARVLKKDKNGLPGLRKKTNKGAALTTDDDYEEY